MSLASEVILALWKLVCNMTEEKNNDFFPSHYSLHFFQIHIDISWPKNNFSKITQVVKIV